MPSDLKPLEASQETASLVKRLAGPSTGKAGLAKDQTEINRIIAEASKGSKFYENEKKKDKELTEKITRILKQRDDALKGVNIQQVESSVDHIMVQLEAHRDLSQAIVHVDMDAFYANVELLFNPDLEGKAFGVGKGVLTTASYEARKYGVRSGMPGFIAKKLCPGLILVPLNFARYIEMSEKVMEIYRRYDPTMCAASIDEGYLNITKYCDEHDLSPEECVQEMRRKVLEETKLTVSAGIASNKMLAKICSDKNKPNGQFCLSPHRKVIIDFMRDLSIRKIPGIGRVNERLLESIGIKTCGDIYLHRATLSLMDKQFGLKFLLRTHLGIASNVVQPGQREERKSIGYERTFAPISDKKKILSKLEECAVELEDDMKSSGWSGRTITVKFKLDTFQVFTRAKTFDRWITKKDDIFAAGKDLLQPEWPLNIRLIGLRVTKLKDLNAPAAPTGGIKRFFETVDVSPHKKRRLPPEPPQHFEPSAAIPGSTAHDPIAIQDQDEYEESMPGFHENDENDADLRMDADDEEHFEPTEQGEEFFMPYVSVPIQAQATLGGEPGTSNPEIHVKPQSAHLMNKASSSQTSRSPPRSVTPTEQPTHSRSLEILEQICPVCSKTLETDNQGLNAHIDFCLSRGAIKEAHAEAASPMKNEARSRQPDLGSVWSGWGKPKSTAKLKGKHKDG